LTNFENEIFHEIPVAVNQQLLLQLGPKHPAANRPSGNEPKNKKLVRRAPSKIEQADCPEQI
jgi:hypothetical protein